jgi:hypothetical protein
LSKTEQGQKLPPTKTTSIARLYIREQYIYLLNRDKKERDRQKKLIVLIILNVNSAPLKLIYNWKAATHPVMP